MGGFWSVPIRKLIKTKLVEGFLIACLDAGSNPADSTISIPITFKYNVLGIFYFFIIGICTVNSILKVKFQIQYYSKHKDMGFRRQFFC